MSDTTKTPGQVAYEAWVESLNYPFNVKEIWDRTSAAVLAHAAPRWHPVSEPVPKTAKYWIRYKSGVEDISILVFGKTYFKNITHWSGPIVPPKF